VKSGRKSTPTETLKLHGGYRADRHADRADVAPPMGEPVKPADLGEVEAALWDQIVPSLVQKKLAGVKDTAALVSLCELWGLYRASYAMAKVAPTDKEIRCAVTGYWGAFDRMAAKFGLTAADYASLKVPKESGKAAVPTRARGTA
jgi:phage terminase small subunit